MFLYYSRVVTGMDYQPEKDTKVSNGVKTPNKKRKLKFALGAVVVMLIAVVVVILT